jgi:3-oxoadipate enol-lactonase
MAFVEHDGARIHWSSLGQGEPLVLLMGLGCTSAMWFRLAPRLARRHRVILLDNRGVGQTEVRHFVVHRVSTMAADVAAVLDAAGEASAHVLGLSMGGMIAQQFAIDFPDRVRSLTLMATNCGGPHAVLADSHVWRLLFSKGEMSPEDNLAAMRPYTYASTTPETVIEEDHGVRLAEYPTLRGYQAQLYGLMGWSSYSKLPRLRCPTLLLHGMEDRLIPPANARLLAERIAGARLIELEGASHWLHSDQPARVAAAVLDFIHPHARGAVGAAA